MTRSIPRFAGLLFCTCRLLVAALLITGAASARGSEPLRIENEFYSVAMDPAGLSFTVQSKRTGAAVLSAGRLGGADGTGATAKVLAVADKTFGAGNGIEVAYPNGNRETIGVHPGLPFVLFHSTLHNGGKEQVVLNHVPSVSAKVGLEKPLNEIRTLGTGGLLAPGKNPGSYAFLAVVDPATRGGVVGGWITHDRGSGVVFSPVEGDAVRIQARIDYGRLRIKPGQDAATETFALGEFADARLGLEAYADAIAKVYSIKLPPQHPGYCTWYMEKYAGACDEKNLATLAEYAAKNLKPFGFDFIQIDDQWQEGISTNGPKKNFTTHAPKGPYPSGMKFTADRIKSLGLTAGIWFMPFAGTASDPYFKDHQDWFVKDPQGKPYETAWGGTCLDMTHPGARQHLREVVARIANDWGYGLFKMDGFWTGSATKQIYVNDGYKEDGIGDAEFSNPDKTNIEALRDGVRLVRETAGPNVFLLGCCVSQNMRSFGGSFGLLDAMRVGPDTGAGHIGAPHASRLWFLNGRVWWNDPDCVSVRTSTTLDQARLNATFTAIADDVFYNSDWMPDFPNDRLDILRRCMPAHGLPSRPVDLFENSIARIWHLPDTRGPRRRDVVALYNWDKAPAHIDCSAARIGLPPAEEYVAFDFWANKFVPPFKETVSADLPPGSCRVLSVQPLSDHPQLLSTSRHITQGMVDVSNERWDAERSVFSATSKVVGGDPYELRFVVPPGRYSGKAIGVGVKPDDAAAGVKAEFKQDGPRLRVTLRSPVSREVGWAVRFERGIVQDIGPKPVENLKGRVEYHRITLTWDENGADRYRVTRDDGKTILTPFAELTETDFPREKPLHYTVEALGWDTGSTPVSVEVKPIAKLVQPPIPPMPSVFLDQLKLNLVKNGYGKAQINRSHSGKSLSLNGKRYEKGLGLHANALVTCPIPAGATRFVATVGVDDGNRHDPRASMTFEVYGDVKEMGEAPVLLGQSPLISPNTVLSWGFDFPLNARFKELRLVVTDAADGNSCDHADWVNAGFVTPAAK